MTGDIEELNSYHWMLIIVLMFVWLLNSTFQMLYSILMPSIMKDLVLDYSTVGLILLMAQPSASIGSFLFGTFADYRGRRRVLSILLLLSSVSIFLVGLSRDLFQFTIALAVFSFVSSGIFPIVFTFASEELPPKKRGFGISVIASGYALGGGVLASFTATSLGLISWRTPFFIGFIPTIIVLMGVLHLAESSIWLRGVERGSKSDRTWIEVVRDFKPFKIWRGEYLRAILSALSVRSLASILWVGVARWATVFLVVEKGMSLAIGTMWFMFFGLAGFFGNWFNGWCADRYGRRKTISLFFSVTGILIIIFTAFINRKLEALLMTAPLGFFLLGLYPTTFTFTTEALPSEARASGMATINLFTVPLSIAMPGIIGAVSTAYSLSLCFQIIALAVIVGGTALFFITPETKAEIL